MSCPYRTVNCRCAAQIEGIDPLPVCPNADMDCPYVGELIELLNKLKLVTKMARDAMVFDARDWSKDRTNAWLWALLVGWDRDAEKEIVARHGSAFHGAISLGRQIEENSTVKEVSSYMPKLKRDLKNKEVVKKG